MRTQHVVGPGYQKTPGSKSVDSEMALACEHAMGLHGFGVWVAIGPRQPIQDDRWAIEDGHEYCIHLSTEEARKLVSFLNQEIATVEDLQRRLGG